MNRPTKTLLGKQARDAVLKGVNAIYEPVKRTIGPEGKTALLYRTFNRGSRITDDGVTVSECQEPKDPHVRLAAQSFKEACKRTVEKVGDGTTTTAVIGGRGYNNVHALLSEGSSEFTSKKNNKGLGVVSLRKKMLETADRVKKAIKEKAVIATELKDLERIATISVKDAEIGKVIAKMAMEVGVDGFIDTVEGYKGEIETETIKGFRFPAKVGAKVFVNNPARYEMVMTDCHVLITNFTLDNAGRIGKMFQKLNANTSRIIVVAPSFSDDVLINMHNAGKQGYFIFPVKAPSLRTEQFEDLAIACGAEFIDKNKGRDVNNVVFRELGFVEKMVVKDTEAREDAVVTGGAGMKDMTRDDDAISSPVKDRIEMLKKQVDEMKDDTHKKLLERRIASMSSAVGIIRVGDSTQASALYRKLKIEDAVYACKAALRGGYVKGGGLCLKEIVDELELSDDDVLKTALLRTV
jgi:chaperonin GroEL